MRDEVGKIPEANGIASMVYREPGPNEEKLSQASMPQILARDTEQPHLPARPARPF